MSFFGLLLVVSCGILKELQVNNYIIVLPLIWILWDILMLSGLMILFIIVLLLVLALLLEAIWWH